MTMHTAGRNERPLTGRGSPSAKLTFSPVRELTESDLVRLQSASLGSASPPLKQIRESHHALARLLSDGLSNTEAGRLTGFSPSRISILRNDPAFANLISHYNSSKDQINADMALQFNAVLLSSLQELQDRILENPEEIPTKDLLDTITRLMDRTGFGPTTKIQQTSITLGAGDISALKEAAAQRRRETTLGGRNQPEVIDHDPNRPNRIPASIEPTQQDPQFTAQEGPTAQKPLKLARHETLSSSLQGAADQEPNGSGNSNMPTKVPGEAPT